MPIYEYECEKTGEIFPEIVSLSEWDKKYIMCKLHAPVDMHYAEKVFSLPANINIAKPSIIFRNPKTGETQIATHDYDQAPHGYVKEELKNPIERSKFEKEQSMRQSVEDAITSERVYTEREEIHRDRQANIRANMGQYDGATQAMLKAAMKRTRKRKFVPKKTEVKFTVNHTDSSNMVK